MLLILLKEKLAGEERVHHLRDESPPRHLLVSLCYFPKYLGTNLKNHLQELNYVFLHVIHLPITRKKKNGW